MAIAHISPKGQILIPKKIRGKYGVKPGGKVHIIENPGGITIRPAPEDPIETVCGFVEGDFSLSEDLERTDELLTFISKPNNMASSKKARMLGVTEADVIRNAADRQTVLRFSAV